MTMMTTVINRMITLALQPRLTLLLLLQMMVIMIVHVITSEDCDSRALDENDDDAILSSLVLP